MKFFRPLMVLLCIALLLAPLFADSEADAFFREVEALKTAREAQHQALREAGRSTPENHRAIDEAYLKKANQPELLAKRAAFLEKLGNPNLRQNPDARAGTSRGGAFGDIDTPEVSAREFQEIRNKAVANGARVHGQGDFLTIEGVDVTVHRAESPYQSPVGSSARSAETVRGLGKETAYGFQTPDPALDVQDNLKKAFDTLNTPADQLTPDDIRRLSKMNQRNLKHAGNTHVDLKQPSDLVKDRYYCPESAGVVRPNATGAERVQDLARFQAESKKLAFDTLRATQEAASRQKAKLQNAVDDAYREYNKAAKSGDPDELAKAREQLSNAKSERIIANERATAAREALLRNQPDAVELFAEADPGKFTKTTGKSGKTLYIDNATGEIRSPSQLRENAVAQTRSDLARSARQPPPDPAKNPVLADPAKPTAFKKGFKAVGFGLFAYGIVVSAIDGADQASAERKDGESSFHTWAKATLYGTWAATGIPGSIAVGKQAGDESMNQYYADLAAGKTPSWVFAKSRGAATGVFNVGKGIVWDLPQHIGTTSWDFATGEKAAQSAQSANAAAQFDTLQNAVISATKLTAQLKILTGTAQDLASRLDRLGQTLIDALPVAMTIRDQNTAARLALETLAPELEVIRTAARSAPVAKPETLRAELAAIRTECISLQTPIRITLDGLKSQALPPADARQGLAAISSRYEAVSARLDRSYPQFSALTTMLSARGLHPRLAEAAAGLKTSQPLLSQAYNSLSNGAAAYAGLAKQFASFAEEHGALRGRLAPALDKFLAQAEPDSQAQAQLLALRRTIAALPPLLSVSERYRQNHLHLIQAVRPLYSLAARIPPEPGNFDDLPQIGDQAASALALLQPEIRSASEAFAQTRDLLRQLQLRLSGIPVAPTLSLSAPPCQAGDNAVLSVTVANPPPQWSVVFEINGSRLNGSRSGSTATARITIANPGSYPATVRLLDAQGNSLARSATNLTVNPKPQVPPPPRPQPPEPGRSNSGSIEKGDQNKTPPEPPAIKPPSKLTREQQQALEAFNLAKANYQACLAHPAANRDTGCYDRMVAAYKHYLDVMGK